jgi:UDP-N-acetylglucosamine 2-epimerase (non-hydrolysing)
MTTVRKLLIVVGTRPEVIKLAPVINEARATTGFDVVVLATAQHRGLLDDTLSAFDIRPAYDLDVMTENQSLSTVCARIVSGVDHVLEKELPDLVVVQGDTTTAFAAALAAFYRAIRVAHVEAGLRSHDRLDPFPEEVNRCLISRLADFNFCPTETAARNLLEEGVDADTVFVTGNTVIDSLLSSIDRPHTPNIDVLSEIDPDSDRIILVTCHRRESFGKPMHDIFSALTLLAERNQNVHVIFPVHPNPNVAEAARRILGGHVRIHRIPPVPYIDFIHLMKRSFLIVSDSGGICEEAPSLRKPVLLIRNVTERPEAILAGTAKLVGTNPDTIIEEVEKLLNNPAEYAKYTAAANPFGDGKAAKRIVEVVRKRLK